MATDRRIDDDRTGDPRTGDPRIGDPRIGDPRTGRTHRVTDAELAVLRRLWRRGPSTIRQLTDALYPEGGASFYATVQKLLDRLAAKGCVSRRGAGRANVYSAEVGRGELIRGRLQEVADTFCGGALAPLLTHLIDGSRLSEDELSTLRRLVAEPDSEDRGG